MKRKAKNETRTRSLAQATLVTAALLIASLVLLKLLSMLMPNAFGWLQHAVAGWGLFGGFVAVFIGSSLLPFPTDAFFASSVALSPNPIAYTIIAAIAATLAGVVNYALAYALSERWVAKHVESSVLHDAKYWLDKYGGIAILFFGVLPVSAVFDPLTLVAGLSRMSVRLFLFWLALSRLIHFTLLAAIAVGVLHA